MKPETSDSELAQMKQKILDQNGEITAEYKILRGFAYVFPRAIHDPSFEPTN